MPVAVVARVAEVPPQRDLRPGERLAGRVEDAAAHDDAVATLLKREPRPCRLCPPGRAGWVLLSWSAFCFPLSGQGGAGGQRDREEAQDGCGLDPGQQH